MTRQDTMRKMNSTIFGIGLLALMGETLVGGRVFAASYIYDNFNSTAGLVLQGYAKPVDGKLRIVPAIGGEGRGGVWLNTKQPVENGFDTTFQIQITKKYVYGADGLAFVIQDPEPALGAAGCNICYGGLTNLVAIKFDDYHWRKHKFVPFDEIAVLAAASPTTPLWDKAADYIASVVKGVNFSDGRVHTVRIVYVPDDLRVYLDDLENPSLAVKINLAKVMNLDNERAWVGFVAASGADWQNHDLISWDFSSPAGPASQETLISTQSEMTNSAPAPTPVYWADNAQVSPTNRLSVDPAFGYRLPSDMDAGYQIEASTNLMEWTPLTNAVLYFRDPSSTNYPQRFYRFLKN